MGHIIRIAAVLFAVYLVGTGLLDVATYFASPLESTGAASAASTGDQLAASVLGSDVPVLVDFYATWCGPCKMQAPIMAQLQQEFAGQPVKIMTVNIDHNRRWADQLQIRSIPTTVVFAKGQVVSRASGVQNAAKLRQRLQAAMPTLQ